MSMICCVTHEPTICRECDRECEDSLWAETHDVRQSLGIECEPDCPVCGAKKAMRILYGVA